MNVLVIYLTNLFYRYNKKKAYNCRNTRTNSFVDNMDIKGKMSANIASVWICRAQHSDVSADNRIVFKMHRNNLKDI